MEKMRAIHSVRHRCRATGNPHMAVRRCWRRCLRNPTWEAPDSTLPDFPMAGTRNVKFHHWGRWTSNRWVVGPATLRPPGPVRMHGFGGASNGPWGDDTGRARKWTRLILIDRENRPIRNVSPARSREKGRSRTQSDNLAGSSPVVWWARVPDWREDCPLVSAKTWPAVLLPCVGRQRTPVRRTVRHSIGYGTACP
jgi:hypothetical protein